MRCRRVNMFDALLELATIDGIDVETAVCVSGLPSRSYMRRWLVRHGRADVWEALR